MPSTEFVEVGSPKVGGYAYAGDLETAIPPTTAAAALVGYSSELGYLSEDGVTVTPQVETEDRKDWGGDVVRTLLTERGAEVTLTLIESGAVTLAEVFGADNVTVVGDAIHLSFDGEVMPHRRFVFELKDGEHVGRLVINDGQVTTPGGGERQYTRTELKQYEITIKCFRDESGKFYHEYKDVEDDS